LKRQQEEENRVFPMLKTVEQMSLASGVGENKLRELMSHGELEYIQVGNRRLIADTAIWDWYNRAKSATTIRCQGEMSEYEHFGTASQKQA